MRFTFITILFLSFLSYSCSPSKKVLPADPIENGIKSQLPIDAYLRGFKKIGDINEDVYIGLYVTDYIESTELILPPSDGDYYITCQELTMGQRLSGNYFAFIYSNNRITSLLKIPDHFNIDDGVNDSLLPLCLYNTPYNNFQQFKYDIDDSTVNDNSTSSIEKADLIQLLDLTGDGFKHEFMLSINTVGCGFVERIVIGYDKSTREIKAYPVIDGKKSYWYMRLRPLNGKCSVIYDCGDHGSDLYSRKDFIFNYQTNQYEISFSEERICTESEMQ